MIVNVVEIMVEYVAIIICMHKTAGKKMAIDRYVIMFAMLNLFSVFVVYRYQNECRLLVPIMYINFLVYAKIRLAEKWEKAIKVFGTMFILIPCLQLVMFYVVKLIFIVCSIPQDRYVVGIIVNCFICILLFLWEKQYVCTFVNRIRKSKGGLVLLLYIFVIIYLLYYYKKVDQVLEPLALQSLITIIAVGIISILWINAENEKRMKAKELKLYETYNRTFEDAVTAIRLRQHEFDNHINAIKCLQLTIDNTDDLIKAQNEYCDKVLQENSYNRLLKLNANPILIGFLYSKFTSAKREEIDIFHEIHAIEMNKKIEITELIELIGILFDNAVEALLEMKNVNKKLIVKILQDDKKMISIEIANMSRRYLNNEIEKFCVQGYSTKGENRGIGLTRVKDIVKKYKADLCIENVNYDGNIFLSVRIKFY